MKKNRKKSKIVWIGLAAVAVVWILVHFTLDIFIKYKANKILATLPEYTGRIDGVSTYLWTAAFALKGVDIHHRNGETALTLKSFRGDLDWLPLFRKQLVGTLTLDHPTFAMRVSKVTKAPEKAKKKAEQANVAVEAKTGETLPDLIKSAIPFRIRALYIVEGQIHIQQPGEQEKGKPSLDVRLTQINLTAQNLSNNPELAEGKLTGTVEASARLFDHSPVDLSMSLNPIAPKPTFHLMADAKEFNITQLNPFLDWQFGISTKKGTLAVFLQADAADGSYKGYAKPLLHDLKMDFQDKNPITIVKEAAVQAVSHILKNPKTENVATEVPFAGTFNGRKTGIWTAVIEVLRNGFIEALRPRFDKNYKPNPKSDWAKPSP